MTQTDPHDLFFGSDEARGPDGSAHPDDLYFADPRDGHDGRDGAFDGSARGLFAPEPGEEHPSGQHLVVAGGRRESRLERTRQAQRRRSRILAVVLVVVLVAIIGVVGLRFGPPILHYFTRTNDYSGSGSGSVQVVVHPGDTASDIADTLYADGVVASTGAFTSAAKSDADSVNIQPGTYALHHHMSAKSALDLLLSPSARINSDVVVPEGATVVDVLHRLTAPTCSAKSSPGTVCGLGLPTAAVQSALNHIGGLGLPTEYTAGGKPPVSAEGFLFPATYPFDGKTSAADALGQMIAKFTDEVRAINFTASAKSLHLTPYQELIIASIAQAEAKYPQDMPKVARVILNRLAARRPLQVDATSAYAAKLAGLDPSTQIYAQTKGPYNTYTHSGLPPTPISNPGESAMRGAAHPARGNWLYYVNIDAAGHLGFFHSATDFEKAVHTCRAHGWCQ